MRGKGYPTVHAHSNLYLIETSLNAFANRADPDQAAPVRAAWSGSTLFANYDISDPTLVDISDPTLVDLTSNFFVPT